MADNPYDMGTIDIAWCPGCGNFMILKELQNVFDEMGLDQKKLVMVSGIGQAAKIPQYVDVHYLNGLHGRHLPVATAIKAVNPELIVISESGDGCTYGEGGNHFIHCIRRNPDITNIVHNNMIYGLTKGQASPTTRRGMATPVQPHGVILEPFNPIAVAVALDASFVARAFSGDREETRSILKKAINHKGYALVDIFQPCITFNKLNTFQWFKENTYYLDDSYDPTNRAAAFEKALETEKFPLGVIYKNPEKKSFEENTRLYEEKSDPLFQREVNQDKIQKLIDSHRKK